MPVGRGPSLSHVGIHDYLAPDLRNAIRPRALAPGLVTGSSAGSLATSVTLRPSLGEMILADRPMGAEAEGAEEAEVVTVGY